MRNVVSAMIQCWMSGGLLLMSGGLLLMSVELRGERR